IPKDIEGYELSTLIKNAIGSEGIKVQKEGNCLDRKWWITFETIPGRQNLPIVTKDNLVFEGEEINFNVGRGIEGRTWHSHIEGDFLSVRRENPHVAVTVNGYRAVCLSNCSFSYFDSGIPTLTS
ncbi:unnamed protein product, partial [Meganyctiphanes norvegica]